MSIWQTAFCIDLIDLSYACIRARATHLPLHAQHAARRDEQGAGQSGPKSSPQLAVSAPARRAIASSTLPREPEPIREPLQTKVPARSSAGARHFRQTWKARNQIPVGKPKPQQREPLHHRGTSRVTSASTDVVNLRRRKHRNMRMAGTFAAREPRHLTPCADSTDMRQVTCASSITYTHSFSPLIASPPCATFP